MPDPARRPVVTEMASTGSPAWAVFRLASRRQRWRTIGWAVFFVAIVGGVVASYAQAYPDAASRSQLAGSILANSTFRAIYGEARALDTVGGFIAWRIGAMSVFAGVWGMLTVTALLRGDEDEGRWEIQAAGPIGRGRLSAVILAATGMNLAFIWICLVLVLVAQGLSLTATLFYVTAFLAPAAFYMGVGALTSQIAATRRSAAAICGTLLGVGFLMKVIGDGARTFRWLLWLTPSGWYEAAHGYTGSSFQPLLVFAVATTVMIGTACFIASRRDIGDGLLFRDSSRSSFRFLLGSVWGAALRQTRWNLTAWILSVMVFSAVIGVLANDLVELIRSQEGFQRLMGSFVSLDYILDAYIGFMFVFVVLPVSLFAVLQLPSIREEESTGRLDLILAQPVGRRRWLIERIIVVAVGAFTIAIVSGLFMWIGARANHVSMDLGQVLLAALNCLPASTLFFGIGVLAFAVLPRASTGIAIGTVLGTYVWYLVGTVAEAPSLVLAISPFHHVAAYPSVPVNTWAAIVMSVGGLILCIAGIEVFARRDLAGA